MVFQQFSLFSVSWMCWVVFRFSGRWFKLQDFGNWLSFSYVTTRMTCQSACTWHCVQSDQCFAQHSEAWVRRKQCTVESVACSDVRFSEIWMKAAACSQLIRWRNFGRSFRFSGPCATSASDSESVKVVCAFVTHLDSQLFQHMFSSFMLSSALFSVCKFLGLVMLFQDVSHFTGFLTRL